MLRRRGTYTVNSDSVVNRSQTKTSDLAVIITKKIGKQKIYYYTNNKKIYIKFKHVGIKHSNMRSLEDKNIVIVVYDCYSKLYVMYFDMR